MTSLIARRQMVRWIAEPRGISTTVAGLRAPNVVLLESSVLADARLSSPASVAWRVPQQQHQQQRRWFGRKGAKMGKHLENMEELAHTKQHDEAVKRRNNKKQAKKGGGAPSITQSNDDNELPPMEEDDDEARFDSGEEGDEDNLPTLPEASEVKQRMLKVVDRLTASFKAIRGAEPSPDLFDCINVEAYGENNVPLSTVAQVVIVGPTLATVSCFDPSLAKDVKNAIQVQLELNPQLEEDGVVKVSLPRPSAESRQKTVKQLGKQAETGRTRIRNIRRAALDVVKKGKDGKLEGISKDDAFRVSKEIDGVTEDAIQLLNQEVEHKQESVMAV